jgi:hypothetical protein
MPCSRLLETPAPGWVALALIASSSACGSRVVVDAGAGGAVASVASSSSTSNGAGGAGAGPVVPSCPTLTLDAGPVTVIDEEGRNAHTPSLVAAGSDGDDARLVVQALLTGTPPSIELASLQLGTGSIAVEVGPTAYASSFTWSPLGLARIGSQAAMVWGNDGLRFGTFDVATWSAGPSAVIALEGGSPIAVVGGASLDPSGQRHDGEGFGLLVDPDLDLLSWPSFALVDANGTLVVEPFPIIAPQPATARGAVAWSGSHYLIATTDPEGCEGTPNCTGLSLFRFVPGADEPFDRTWSRPKAFVDDVALAPVGDEVWLVYLDPGGYDVDPYPQLLRLDREGAPLGDPTLVGGLSGHGVRLAAIPGGALLVLRTGSTPGGEVRAIHLDDQGGVIGTSIAVAADDFTSWGPQAVTAFDGGVAVAGASYDSGHSTVSVTTLRCQASPP